MYEMLRAYKYRLYPTSAQQKQIDQAMSICRYVYNIGLETKIRAWQSSRINLSAYDLQKQLTEAKKEFPWLCQASSNALDASLSNLDRSLKSFFNGGGFPNFKSKRGKQSFQIKNGVRRLDTINGLLTITRIKNIPIEISRKFEGKIRTVTISKTVTGKYFSSILVLTNATLPEKKNVSEARTIGIDLGIKSFAITSDGRAFEPNRFLKNSLKRLQCLQRRASRKKKGGKNRKKFNLKIALLHEKISNQRVDYVHKITTGLVHDSQVDTFVIEDLNVSGMLKNFRLSQAVSDVSFSEFTRQMKYKSEWCGKNLITIGRFDPSSKRCSDCGVINQELTLGDREWTCACGTHHDRDLNAAKNIKHFGLEKYSRRGTPVEPVELSALAETVKQEVVLQKTARQIEKQPTTLNQGV